MTIKIHSHINYHRGTLVLMTYIIGDFVDDKDGLSCAMQIDNYPLFI
jgi:hypothetical protein